MTRDLKEVDDFFNERILGWMITDLKRSVDAKTNFLTALGCLTYTEAIGTLLPPIEGERGSVKAKRFYRCLFRLPSGESLKQLDTVIRSETSVHKGLYEHLRHSAAHLYTPQIRRVKDGHNEFMPVVVAKLLKGEGAPPPMWQRANESGEAEFLIGTQNYVSELETACRQFYKTIVQDQESEWVDAAITGLGVLNKGLH
jgi:hypothetical protein